jgi:sucrose-6-phosphate hydrolase SacC (GH32 family)
MYNNSFDFEILTSLAFEINFRINKIEYIDLDVKKYQNIILKNKNKIINKDNFINNLKQEQTKIIKNDKIHLLIKIKKTINEK